MIHTSYLNLVVSYQTKLTLDSSFRSVLSALPKAGKREGGEIVLEHAGLAFSHYTTAHRCVAIVMYFNYEPEDYFESFPTM